MSDIHRVPPLQSLKMSQTKNLLQGLPMSRVHIFYIADLNSESGNRALVPFIVI